MGLDPPHGVVVGAGDHLDAAVLEVRDELGMGDDDGHGLMRVTPTEPDPLPGDDDRPGG
jgi:hypothetical protein